MKHQLQLEIVLNHFPHFLPINFQLNHTTILYLTSKELNKEPLSHLERLIKHASNGCAADDDGVHEFLHGKLFGDRESVAQLLNDERKWKFRPPPRSIQLLFHL